MKIKHYLFIALGYEVVAYAWNNYSGSTFVLPLDFISKVL
jgi:hypothetical protein